MQLALTASRQAVAGRPLVTAGLRPIPDNVAIRGDNNTVGTLWTTISHQFIKQMLKDEIAKLVRITSHCPLCPALTCHCSQQTSRAAIVHKLVHSGLVSCLPIICTCQR